MIGTNSSTGRTLEGLEHLRQSIRDILSTPVGSRVMRRDYGSNLYELVDRPFTPSIRLAIIAATAEAIMNWEPRIDVESVTLSAFEPGRISVDLMGRYLPDGDEIQIDGIEVT